MPSRNFRLEKNEPEETRSDSVQEAVETSSLLGEDDADSGNEDGHDWFLTTASLASTMLVQSYLLVSVFPYSGFLAMHLVPGLNEETAGSYAGLIASSFMFGRTFSSFEWGKAADRYGRVFVIQVSLLLSGIVSVLFGFAPTLYSALFWRFVLGLCNGLIGPIKTLVSEFAKGDTVKETKTLALVVGMWGYGFLINPAIGGYLSDPVKQYPNNALVDLFRPMLTQFPFVLPNLVGCLVCLAASIMVFYFVDETLPSSKREKFQFSHVLGCCNRKNFLLRTVSSWGIFKQLHPIDDDANHTELRSSAQVNDDPKNSNNQILRWMSPSPSTTALGILSSRSVAREQEEARIVSTTAYQTFDDDIEGNEYKDDQKQPQQQPATITSLWNRTSTREHLMVYWVYSFLIVAIDETFPLFCISKDSGLSITEKQIGNLLTGCGLFYITMQYFLVTRLVDWYGFYRTMRIGCLMSIPLCCLFPLSLWFQKGATNDSQGVADETSLKWSTLIFLSILYATIRSFSAVAFSTLTMTTNRTVPPHQRATMNGLSMLGGSFAKGIGPVFAGILFSNSVNEIVPPYGSVLVYCVIAILGLLLCLQTMYLTEQDDSPSTMAVKKNNDGKSHPSWKDNDDDEEDDQAPAF